MQRVSAKLIPFLLVLAMGASASAADAPASAELTQLLQNFLKAASTNDAATFDSFFADDVIYTRSSGVTISKADIMRGLRGQGNEANRPAERASQTYDADQITAYVYLNFETVIYRVRRTQLFESNLRELRAHRLHELFGIHTWRHGETHGSEPQRVSMSKSSSRTSARIAACGTARKRSPSNVISTAALRKKRA